MLLGLIVLAAGACGSTPTGSPRASATVAGSGVPSPTAPAAPQTPLASPTASASPSASATPRTIASVTVVGAIGPAGALEPGSPSALASAGAEAAAARLSAMASRLTPRTAAERAAMIERAATDSTVVVTVSQDALGPTIGAALAHPDVEFLAVDAVLPATSPGNVRALLFDEAEVGYLAGWLAAVVTPLGPVGLVGDSAADGTTANFERGFRAGAAEGRSGAAAVVAYASASDAPDRGRAAVDRLRAAGATAIAAMSDLSGVGAIRQACLRKLPAVALGSDAWLRFPELQPCLVGSVVERTDVAVTDALLAYAAGGDAGGTIVGDVAGGWIGVSSLHGALPDGLDARLGELLAVLRAGPPRPTPAPSPTPTPTPTPTPLPSPTIGSALPSSPAGPSPSGQGRRSTARDRDRA